LHPHRTTGKIIVSPLEQRYQIKNFLFLYENVGEA
jgi:hypothetical protein